MNHQITLEELGIVPKLEQDKRIEPINYAFPCGGCLCNHCANNVECMDQCAGEADCFCYICDECKFYDGKGKNMLKTECSRYKETDQRARYMRSKFKVVKYAR
jgi:hypothetical protein